MKSLIHVSVLGLSLMVTGAFAQTTAAPAAPATAKPAAAANKVAEKPAPAPAAKAAEKPATPAKAAPAPAAPTADKAAPAKTVDGKKPPSEKQLKQREKMKNCHADAKTKGLKGQERQNFMSTCLKA